MPQSKRHKPPGRRPSTPEGDGTAPIDPKLLALRVEHNLPPGFATSKPMFGGITFLHRGNMLCCASREGLMVRVGADAEPEALSSPFASRCLGAGRPMAGFIIIEPRGLRADEDIARWLGMARTYVETLPAKAAKHAKPKKAIVINSNSRGRLK